MPDVLDTYDWPTTLDDRAKAIFDVIKDGRVYRYTKAEIIGLKSTAAPSNAMVLGRLKRIKDIAHIAGYDTRYAYSVHEDRVVIQVKKIREEWTQ